MTQAWLSSVSAQMMLKAAIFILIALAVGVIAAIVYGARSWQAGTTALERALNAARAPITPGIFDSRELEGLPSPVQRYLRAVLTEGQPLIVAARISHQGRFNMREAQDQWRPFTSTQLVITQRPGFAWNARIAMAPGVPVFVHDAYVAGEGLLRAAVLGLVTVADIRGTPEAAQGELMRFLAEAAWYPTRLLPSPDLQWEAIDDSSARATLTDGPTSVSLEFAFDHDGLIESVRAAARYRTVNGSLIATPWHGRFWAYSLRDGMRIPLEGEVAWQRPEGPRPYWQGRVTNITYEFAP